MTESKTIHLTIVIRDPGEWCHKFDDIPCPLVSRFDSSHCAANHLPEMVLDNDGEVIGYRRPQLCKDAERKS